MHTRQGGIVLIPPFYFALQRQAHEPIIDSMTWRHDLRLKFKRWSER